MVFLKIPNIKILSKNSLAEILAENYFRVGCFYFILKLQVAAAVLF